MQHRVFAVRSALAAGREPACDASVL